VLGQDIFDVLLVAQMRAHAIGTLCTYNAEDFRGYGGITVERPRDTLDRFGFS
jgi:predicted nucleic acid-binding protein